MRYIKLLLEYDGSNYQGWQSQKSGSTIQDTLRSAIFSITGEHVKLAGASRTDAGVHALGQVAVFGTQSNLLTATILRALNAKLPHDIRIRTSTETERTFNPRYGALRKSYFYVISEKPIQSVFLYKYAWNVKTELCFADMKKAAAMIVGTNDFSSFRASGCSSKNAVRTIYSIDISKYKKMSFMTAGIKGDFIKIRIEANAFLRHMARNIVGTLVEIGKGRMSPQNMKKILKSCDRKTAGPTAPANGLFLERIIYSKD